MELNLKTLICFKRIAELENMSKASEELYISQAHLSRMISALENELGVSLFDREGRGIKLNSCGQLYYEYTCKIINLVDEAYKSTRDEYSRMRAKLSVATNAGAYLPNLFYILVTEDPALQLKQYSHSRKRLIQMLIEEKVDFNIICPPTDNKEFESIPLHKEPAVIIYPDNHWLNNRDVVSLHELEEEDFVGVNLGYGARDSVEIMYRENNFQPHFVIETADTAMVKQYVSRGLGIAVVPETLMLFDSYYKNHYTRIKEDVYGVLSLEWNKERILDAYDIHFINTTLKYFFDLSKSVHTNTTDKALTYDDIFKKGND